jgi:pimeloyl-ACP methyl ester carboxylesterase
VNDKTIRQRLLAGVPVRERRVQVAGISTPVLEGGEGPPVLLLHGPGEYAAKWMHVLPGLARTHRVVAPDLPGHGASTWTGGALDADRVFTWLEGIIGHTCDAAPMLVGQIVGGAIAARFVADLGEKVGSLVLSDTMGLAPFQPAPEFGAALAAYLERPAPETHEGLWRYCAHDLDRLRARLGERWGLLEAYNLDRARSPEASSAMHALMQEFGFPAIPPATLERIAIPTTLIWGRHDLATSLAVAEAASERYGWPLDVIDDAGDDPPMEQPERFLAALERHGARLREWLPTSTSPSQR